MMNWHGECDCRPTDGFHQYSCPVSFRMRRDRAEAGKANRPDPTVRARALTVGPEVLCRLMGTPIVPGIPIGRPPCTTLCGGNDCTYTRRETPGH
jgi:hypothetical protein